MKILILALICGVLCLLINTTNGNIAGTLMLVADALAVAAMDLGAFTPARVTRVIQPHGAIIWRA